MEKGAGFSYALEELFSVIFFLPFFVQHFMIYLLTEVYFLLGKLIIGEGRSLDQMHVPFSFFPSQYITVSA